MSPYVRLTDVSPRDGLQNERGIVPTEEKVELIRLLADAGVDEIEATSFVSPKWIPQLADAADVLRILKGDSPSPRGRGVRGEGAGESRARGTRSARPDGGSDRARRLRTGATPPERTLWSRLKADQIHGARFRRQHPLGPYIADFYCPEANLVIELDGDSHEGEAARRRDAQRERWMNERGIYVERFTNQQIGTSLEAVVKRIGDLVSERRRDLPLPGPLPRGEGDRPPPAIIALVPNRKGFERALEIHCDDFPLKIAVFTAASETFSRKNTNASVAETIERFREFVPEAVERRMLVRCYISCAIACPYEGYVEPARVREVADRLRELAPDSAWESGRVELDLGDTNGVGDSVRTRRLLEVFEADERRRMTLHFHDTFGRAGECVREALGMGVLSFDGAVAGLGGCPYAGTEDEPAPGNVSTERVASIARAEGFEVGVDIDRLRKVAERARQISHEATARAAEAAS